MPVVKKNGAQSVWMRRDFFRGRRHYLGMTVSRNAKLFRAIVIMGASLTASACDDDKCAACQPPVDANKVADAGVDAKAPSDAPVDVVLIL